MRVPCALFVMIGSLLAASPLAAQYHVGAMPQRVASVQNGRVVLSSTVMVRRYTTKEVEFADENGKKATKTIQETQQVPDTLIWTYSAEDLNPYTADRRAIDPADLLKRLEAEAVVFVCEPCQKADAAFVSLLKPETVCLFVPMRNAAPPAEPGPMPTPPKRSLPVATQPMAALASISAEGKCFVRERSVSVFENTAYRTETTPQGKQQVPYSIKSTSTTESVKEMPASEVRAFDLSGKPVSATDLAAALKAETAVLVSGDGQRVDPAFLEIIKPGTLILALPQPGPPEPLPGEAGPPPSPT